MITALGLISVILIFSVPAFWIKKNIQGFYFTARTSYLHAISRKTAHALCLGAIIMCNTAVFLPSIGVIGTCVVQTIHFLDTRPRQIPPQRGVVTAPKGSILFMDIKACYNRCIFWQKTDDFERCGPSVWLPPGTNLTYYLEITDEFNEAMPAHCYKVKTNDGLDGWI